MTIATELASFFGNGAPRFRNTIAIAQYSGYVRVMFIWLESLDRFDHAMRQFIFLPFLYGRIKLSRLSNNGMEVPLRELDVAIST